LLHLIKSLKSKGKACIVLPLGVLFRGNTEADIRKRIIQMGYIKGIIGLPPNLFYGTGISACLVVIDKEDSDKRQSIFMIDASRGFMKDGNKNRLREQDIHRIVDTFNKKITTDPKYAREIPVTEIADPKNDYNLNIPRYIDSQEAEDIQDIEAHLLGGIPKRDIDALNNYWEVYPSMKQNLFSSLKARPDFYELKIDHDEIKNTIYQHPEFTGYATEMSEVFKKWQAETALYCKKLDKGLHPKKEIKKISEELLKVYDNRKLTDKYAMYQHIMNYWTETMQDDFYELAADGWEAGREVKRIEKKTNKGEREIIKQVPGIEGLEGRLIPPFLLIQIYFAKEQQAIDDLETETELLKSKMEELREEHGGDEGLLANAIDKGKISKNSLIKAIKELGHRNEDNAEEFDMLAAYKKLVDKEAFLQTQIKTAKAQLENKVIEKYPALTIEEIKTIVVDKKWLPQIEIRIKTEMDNISHRLTQRIKELAERYETPLPKQTSDVADLEAKVNAHLQKMGFVWK